jgi:hypothetical protein
VPDQRNPADSLSSITCPTLGGTVSAKSVLSRVGRFPGWYGRTPARVLLSRELSSDAVRIYGILALKTSEGSISTLGMRVLGELLGKGRTTIQRRLRELVTHGDLVMHKDGNGKRAYYELTSTVFSARKVERRAVPARKSPGKTYLSPTVRQARAFAENQAARQRDTA